MTANTRTRAVPSRLALAACLWLGVPSVAAAQAPPHAALMQAYRQSVAYLTSTLQQSDRTAAIDATVTVLAVHRALAQAIEADVARIHAASRRVQLPESSLRRLVTDADIERMTHIMFAGNWIGAANVFARQLAIDGAATAINTTEAVLAALGPAIQRANTVTPLPPALTQKITVTRQTSGAYLLAVELRNVGAEAAQSTKLALGGDDPAGGAAQEVSIGALAPGAGVQHVFVTALPAGESVGVASVTASAANATSLVSLVDLDGN